MKKTNALRALDQKKVPYTALPYDATDGGIDGISVAHKINKPEDMVYKTLLLSGAKGHYVAIIPVGASLDLKKAAQVFKEKSVQMLHVKELLPLTGYERGGCSPIGMKKHFPTCLDESARAQEEIVVSAGAIGLQMQLKTLDLMRETNAQIAPICANE